MKNILVAAVLLVSLSGCGVEIWESEIKSMTSSGYEGRTVLWSTWKFTREGCALSRMAAENNLKRTHRRVWTTSCKITAYYGF